MLGRIAEIAVLGSDESAARARVQANVRASFDAMARELRLMALGLADPQTVAAAADGDPLASRRLFAAADAALAQAQGADYALTAYAIDGRPLAWDGRPSELPLDRVEGEEAWFFTRSALGLRLVYVAPVATPAANALARWLPNGRSIRRWRRLPTPRSFDIEPASRPCPSSYDSKGRARDRTHRPSRSRPRSAGSC